MHIIESMTKYKELSQRLILLSELIAQYESGLKAVKEGSEDALKFQGTLEKLQKNYSECVDITENIKATMEQFQGLVYK